MESAAAADHFILGRPLMQLQIHYRGGSESFCHNYQPQQIVQNIWIAYHTARISHLPQLAQKMEFSWWS